MMDIRTSRRYAESFEQAVALGVQQKLWGLEQAVSTRPGKLSTGPMGKFLGVEIDTDIAMALDYYGYVKKSRGLLTTLRSNGRPRFIVTPVVFFNGIKLEVLARVSPELVLGFVEFKSAVLDIRGFRHKFANVCKNDLDK